MLKVTNVSKRIVYIGSVHLAPSMSHIFEERLSDEISAKIDALFNLGLIQIASVNDTQTKKKNKK